MCEQIRIEYSVQVDTIEYFDMDINLIRSVDAWMLR